MDTQIANLLMGWVPYTNMKFPKKNTSKNVKSVSNEKN